MAASLVSSRSRNPPPTEAIARKAETDLRRRPVMAYRPGLLTVNATTVTVAVIEITSERIDRQPAISQKPNARRAQSKEVAPPFGILGDAERDARKTLPAAISRLRSKRIV